MPPGFSGNLIFAIIARMLCGNYLKSATLNINEDGQRRWNIDNGFFCTYSFCEFVKADLHGTTLSHTTSLRQAYDKLTTGLRHRKRVVGQAPVVQRLDNAIHRINRYPADKC